MGFESLLGTEGNRVNGESQLLCFLRSLLLKMRVPSLQKMRCHCLVGSVWKLPLGEADWTNLWVRFNRLWPASAGGSVQRRTLDELAECLLMSHGNELRRSCKCVRSSAGAMNRSVGTTIATGGSRVYGFSFFSCRLWPRANTIAYDFCPL